MVDHFSIPDMRQDCAVKPFTLRVAMFIVDLMGRVLGFSGVSGFWSLGVGGYGCVPLRVPLVRPSFCSLWPGGEVEAVADVGVGGLGRGIGLLGIPLVPFKMRLHALLLAIYVQYICTAII